MLEKSHKYDITQCALYKIKGSKQLKKVLCITEEEYKDILSIVHYHSFQIDKKDSTEKRNITGNTNQNIKAITECGETYMANFWRKREMLYR